MQANLTVDIKAFLVPQFVNPVSTDTPTVWPRISIIIPSFNQAEYIERTLLSVLNQDYSNKEVIVIDGGSTDGTAELLKRYGGGFAYWQSQRDGGQADAIAQGFERATGDILAWLNSDDIYLPGTLSAVAKYFRLPHGGDVLTGNVYAIDERDNVIVERRQTSFLRAAYVYGAADMLQPATFWTRRIYDVCGGIERTLTYSIDTQLFYAFLSHGAAVESTPQFLAGFRSHPSSKTFLCRHVGLKEDEFLRSRYWGVPRKSLQTRVTRLIMLGVRCILYITQGDGLWLVTRIGDRVRRWLARSRV